ncbi:MAG: retroviral-like aspartic protease family protein [Deltaproteobacteria bacterium]|nr:retroviral-like aspartic protease family protein [Deltaproteobacteria bacterium]
MPIRDCPFTNCGNGIYRPILPVRIINPHSNKGIYTYGIIDTGADECAVPAGVAPILGHDLQAGQVKNINTGNGVTVAYSHMTKFEVFHPATGESLYTVPDTPIDFMPNLHVVLLGVNSFLSRFILTVNYPLKIFSIAAPR